MALHVEILEPAKAIPKGRGYVGLAEKGGQLFFPAVDSCLAVTLVLDTGRLIGGHMALKDCPVGMQRVYELMKANLDNEEGRIKAFITVGDLGNWTEHRYRMMGDLELDPLGDAMLELATNKVLAGGVNVTITADQVRLQLCNKLDKVGTFEVPKNAREGGVKEWA
jgi:hypothetical protein